MRKWKRGNDDFAVVMVAAALPQRNPEMKYPMNTRQGRELRRNDSSQFNPHTLQPHSKKWLDELRRFGMRRNRTHIIR